MRVGTVPLDEVYDTRIAAANVRFIATLLYRHSGGNIRMVHPALTFHFSRFFSTYFLLQYRAHGYGQIGVKISPNLCERELLR